MRKRIMVLAAVICAAALAWGGWALWGAGGSGNKSGAASYRLGKLERRDLMKSISATGTLGAVVTVDVGTEISGTIQEILADYNSKVRKKQVIARINPDDCKAKVRQAKAELAVAQAKLLSQQAEVLRSKAQVQNAGSSLAAARARTAKAKAVLENAHRTFERKKALVGKEYISQTDYDTAVTSYEEAKAQYEQAQANQRASHSQVRAQEASLSMSLAQVKEAEANIQLKQAALENRQVDLEHTIIRSPVDGVVIDRNVDVGQTVAASLQAPVLFTIAQDLSKMEVSTSVDEADIGAIKDGQPSYFTVDAYGTRKFIGAVKQIRKAAKTVQNVVTYTVVISAGNRDFSLMPGMTADVRIVVAEKRGVLAVPNAALRFKPANAAALNANNQNPNGGQNGGGGNLEARLAKLTKQLKLSPGQRARIKEGLIKQRQKMKAASQANPMRMDSSRQREQRRKQFQAIIMASLTPEQRDAYRLLASGRLGNKQMGTIWRLGAKGNPRPLRVALGVSDGSYTEVSGPDLKPGLKIILGVK